MYATILAASSPIPDMMAPPMMVMHGGMPSHFMIFLLLHSIFCVLVALGVLLFVIWAVKHLPAQKLLHLATWLFTAGFVGMVMLVAMNELAEHEGLTVKKWHSPMMQRWEEDYPAMPRWDDLEWDEGMMEAEYDEASSAGTVSSDAAMSAAAATSSVQ